MAPFVLLTIMDIRKLVMIPLDQIFHSHSHLSTVIYNVEGIENFQRHMAKRDQVFPNNIKYIS